MFVVPRFSVDGEPDHELDRDLSGLQIESTRYGRPSMHAEFAAAPTLEVGATIQVSLATDSVQQVVFDGQITVIEFAFDKGSPPSVSVSAAATSYSQPETSTSTRVLTRGRELVSAHVRVQKARAFVTVTGATTGSPDIVVGSVLRLEQIGTSFSGDGYHVTRIADSFDAEHGFRSTFEAQRAL